MALGSTQPLTEMSTRNISCGGKGGRCVGLTNLPRSYADCLHSVTLNEPEPTGSVQGGTNNISPLFIWISGTVTSNSPSKYRVSKDTWFLNCVFRNGLTSVEPFLEKQCHRLTRTAMALSLVSLGQTRSLEIMTSSWYVGLKLVVAFACELILLFPFVFYLVWAA